jgi:hypothetical protein
VPDRNGHHLQVDSIATYWVDAETFCEVRVLRLDNDDEYFVKRDGPVNRLLRERLNAAADNRVDLGRLLEGEVDMPMPVTEEVIDHNVPEAPFTVAGSRISAWFSADRSAPEQPIWRGAGSQ